MTVQRCFNISYLVVIHGLLLAATLNPNLIDRVRDRLGLLSPELTEFYWKTVSAHKRMDALNPDGSIVFIGDSITQGLATASLYPQSVNYGIGGDTTLGVLQRLPFYRSSIHGSKLVVLAVGVNDLKRREIKEILQNYQKIFEQLSNTQVLVSAVLPVDEKMAPSFIRNKDILELNAGLKLLVDQFENIEWLDVRQSLQGESLQLKPMYHEGDGVHLSPLGYRVWMSAMKLSIHDILSFVHGGGDFND